MQRLAVVLFASGLVLGCDKSTATDGANASPTANDSGTKPETQPKAKSDGAPPADPVASADGQTRPQDSGTKAAVGKPAPDFELVDLEGAKHKLSDYAGKTVVLEWFNPECPFVQYAHTKGPLVSMAKEATDQGVVWLAVNSGAPSMQGHDPAKNKEMVGTFGMAHPVLRDVDGVVGHLYGAAKTPHMYLIDDKGTLVYAGGIDNAPFGEVADGSQKVGFLADALTALRAGTPIGVAEAPPWGCTVKYAKKG